MVVGVICKASSGSTAKVSIAFAEPSVKIFKAMSFVKSCDKFLLNFNVSISSNIWDKEMPKLAKKVEISFLNNEDNFSDQDWKNLYKLAEDTFVEETDSLKEGAAGAGLTDND